MRLASLLLAAPLIYAAIGLGTLRLVGAHRNRAELAPLTGLVVAGWVPQVALLLGGVPLFVGGVLAILAAVALLALRDLSRDSVVPLLLRLYGCYAVGILLFSLAAVPAPGLWGTDWAMYVRAGQALLEYAGDPNAFAAIPEMVSSRPRLFAARPHLFSTAISPLAGWAPPLVVLEVLAAVSGASLLVALSFVARRLGRREPTGLWLAFFLSLPLYGYHLLALWPKFVATAAVLVALADGYAYRKERRSADWLAAWIWMGFALAAHHASALYVPLLLLISARTATRDLARAAVLAVLAVLITAGVYEAWALSKLGASARIASNPSIYQASSFDPVFVVWKTLQQLFASVVGSGIPYAARNLALAATEPLWISLGHLNYAVSGWLVFLAGTFVGNLLPVLCVARRELAARWREARAHEMFSPVLIGLGIALIGASLLAPIVHLSAAQLGSTPTCVLLVYFASSSLPRPVLRRALWFSLAVGTLPLALHLVATRIAFERALSTHPDWLEWFLRFEADTRLLSSLEATPLSQALHPLGALVLAALVGLALFRVVRTARHPA